jgi:hypothetical protein
MSRPILRKSWLRLSQWSALLLGAVFASSAWGGKPDLQPTGSTAGPRDQSSPHFGEILIRTEGAKIYVSQDGSGFEELSLGETPDAAALRKLLSDAGAAKAPVSVPIGSIIVASGGGAGDGAKPKPPDATGTGPAPTGSAPAATGTGQKDPNTRKRGAPR